ncbi:hypothetical protein [Streptomyces longwoodensis]|uniref:hypothetical protein n=1 Tax=Streptomyces longwoodensis TaxID=68231 RepID=UPI003850712E
MSPLPPIGAEIPCSAPALNTPLKIRTSMVSVDFRGGWKTRVEADTSDPENRVRLKLVGFRMTAELPGGDDGNRCTVTIEQSSEDAAVQSLLRVAKSSPRTYENELVLSPFTMIIDQPDAEPLTLTTKNSAKLIATLTQFPPRGDLYQLAAPVDLVDPDNPGITIATIQKFPAKAGGL